MGKLIFHTDSKEALYIIDRLRDDRKFCKSRFVSIDKAKIVVTNNSITHPVMNELPKKCVFVWDTYSFNGALDRELVAHSTPSLLMTAIYLSIKVLILM